LATVITNLLSAIPIFGQDIVELIHNFVTELLTIFGNEGLILNQTVISVLPTIGTVSPQALKKGVSRRPCARRHQLRLNKNEYLSIPYQFISFLVGLIDGDGYIQITKTTKGFITIKLVIGLGLDDLSTLEYIHSVLKLGKITIYRDYRNPICKLIINKTDLQEIVFPLLIYHNIFFLTNTRRDQFNLAIHIFKNNLKSFENIPNINDIGCLPLGRQRTLSPEGQRTLSQEEGPACFYSYFTPAAAGNKNKKRRLTAKDYLKLEFFRN
jgi:hypothetical protein